MYYLQLIIGFRATRKLLFQHYCSAVLKMLFVNMFKPTLTAEVLLHVLLLLKTSRISVKETTGLKKKHSDDKVFT